MNRIQCSKHARCLDELRETSDRESQEPDDHYGSEKGSDSCASSTLHDKEPDQHDDCCRSDVGLQPWGGYL